MLNLISAVLLDDMACFCLLFMIANFIFAVVTLIFIYIHREH